MQKNFRCSAIVLLLAGLVSLNAHAQGVGDDGCKVLEDMVRTPVAAAGGIAQPVFTQPGGVLPGRASTTCSTTASAVSAGFTQALAQLNLYVTWPSPTPGGGDLCLSADLSQCYPEQSPYLPAMSFADAAFVANNWEAVRQSVYLAMPNGAASDFSQFSSTYLKVNLEQRIGGVAPKFSLDY